MVLKKHQIKVVMPDLYDILHILITDHNGLFHAVMRVTPDHMAKLQAQPEDGIPRYFSLNDQVVMFYPRPERAYDDVHIEYLPPVQSL